MTEASKQSGRQPSDHEHGARREGRERGSLRGLHSLSVSGVVEEEPRALHFRARLSGGLQHRATWRRAVSDADRMPGAQRIEGRARRHQRPLPSSDGARSGNAADADRRDARGRGAGFRGRAGSARRRTALPDLAGGGGTEGGSAQLSPCAKRGRRRTSSSSRPRARSNRFGARTAKSALFSCAGRMPCAA